jgi:hypothetical protein
LKKFWIRHLFSKNHEKYIFKKSRNRLPVFEIHAHNICWIPVPQVSTLTSSSISSSPCSHRHRPCGHRPSLHHGRRPLMRCVSSPRSSLRRRPLMRHAPSCTPPPSTVAGLSCATCSWPHELRALASSFFGLVLSCELRAPPSCKNVESIIEKCWIHRFKMLR